MKINLYSPDECRIWCRSFLDGDDVDFEELEKVDLELGEVPDWYNQSDDRVCEMFDPGCAFFYDDRPWELPDRARFLLQEGLAPGQAFLVCVTEPHWYRCGGEYEEWDVEYYCDVIEKASWTPAQSANAWRRFLKEAPASLVAERAAQAKEHRRRKKARKYMAVHRVSYGGYYDDDYGYDGYGPGVGIYLGPN